MAKLSDKDIAAMIKDKIANKGDVNPCKLWSAAEVEIRRSAVIRLIRKGMSKRVIQDYICENWGVCRCTANNYYKDALLCLNEDDKEIIERERDKQLERLNGILQEALKAKDFKDALYAADLINKLGGLYTEKKDITLKDVDIKFLFGAE